MSSALAMSASRSRSPAIGAPVHGSERKFPLRFRQVRIPDTRHHQRSHVRHSGNAHSHSQLVAVTVSNGMPTGTSWQPAAVDHAAAAQRRQQAGRQHATRMQRTVAGLRDCSVTSGRVHGATPRDAPTGARGQHGLTTRRARGPRPSAHAAATRGERDGTAPAAAVALRDTQQPAFAAPRDGQRGCGRKAMKVWVGSLGTISAPRREGMSHLSAQASRLRQQPMVPAGSE